MNFKTISLSAAVTATVVASTTLIGSPAHALSFGDTLDFAGESRLEINEVTGNALLNFDSNALLGVVDYSNPTGKAVVGAGSDLGFGIGGSIINLKDLSLVANGVNSLGFKKWKLGSSVTDFLAIAAPPNVKFTLTNFFLEQTASRSFAAEFAGKFTSPNVLSGIGDYTTQGRFKTVGSTYSGSLTAVPTPALLPGLIALGAGVLRKRKSEVAAEAEA